MSDRDRPATVSDALAALDRLAEFAAGYGMNANQADVGCVLRAVRSMQLEIAEIHKTTGRLEAQLDALMTTVEDGSDIVALPDLTGSYGEYLHRTERPVPGPTPQPDGATGAS